MPGDICNNIPGAHYLDQDIQLADKLQNVLCIHIIRARFAVWIDTAKILTPDIAAEIGIIRPLPSERHRGVDIVPHAVEHSGIQIAVGLGDPRGGHRSVQAVPLNACGVQSLRQTVNDRVPALFLEIVGVPTGHQRRLGVGPVRPVKQGKVGGQNGNIHDVIRVVCGGVLYAKVISVIDFYIDGVGGVRVQRDDPVVQIFTLINRQLVSRCGRRESLDAGRRCSRICHDVERRVRVIFAAQVECDDIANLHAADGYSQAFGGVGCNCKTRRHRQAPPLRKFGDRRAGVDILHIRAVDNIDYARAGIDEEPGCTFHALKIARRCLRHRVPEPKPVIELFNHADRTAGITKQHIGVVHSGGTVRGCSRYESDGGIPSRI